MIKYSKHFPELLPSTLSAIACILIPKICHVRMPKFYIRFTNNRSYSAEGWISVPQQMPMNCPPGLQYLTSVDSLYVKQKVELLEGRYSSFVCIERCDNICILIRLTHVSSIHRIRNEQQVYHQE